MKLILRVLQLAATLTIAACTGTGGVSVEDEQQAGARAARQVEEQVGIYRAEFLMTYVDTIGRRLIVNIGETPYYFKFRVIDQAEPNAFATPGGYIFVSRGMMALINTEDELAGVLAHEISHVTLRHHARQSQRGVLPGVLALPGRAVRAVVGEDIGNIINAPIEAAGQAYLSSYSRAQETEADRVGIRLAAKAGYDPNALGTVLRNLARTTALLSGRSHQFSFFDSHPTMPNRIGDIEREAGDLAWRPGKPYAKDTAALYKRLDGLTWGPNNPMQGIFVGRQFMQPDMNLSIEFPDGWRMLNTPRYVGAFAPEGDAIVLFGSPDRPGDTSELASAFIEEISKALDIEPWEPIATRVGEWDAHLVKLEDELGAEPVSIYYLWANTGRSIFRIVALGSNRYDEQLRETGESLRRLTRDELDSIMDRRIRIVTAVDGENLASMSVRTENAMPDDLTAAINGLADDATLESGQLIKILREEPYITR